MALNIYEQKLARIIAKSKVKLTTTQLSNKSGIPWQKTKDNLESLRKKAPISRQTLGNRIYWFVRKK